MNKNTSAAATGENVDRKNMNAKNATNLKQDFKKLPEIVDICPPSGDMAPSFLGTDKLNGLLDDAIFFADSFLRHSIHIKFSDFRNIFRFKFCRPIFFSLKRNLSSFRDHIAHVVFLRSDKQMIRIYAKRPIASVKNKHSFRDCSEVNLIRKTMGQIIFGIKSTISVAGFCPNPNPATRSFINVFPKSYFRWDNNCFCLTSTGATSRRSITDRLLAIKAGFGRLFTHRKITPFGDTPRVVNATPGPFFEYSTTLKRLLFLLLGFSAANCFGAIGGGIGGSFIQSQNTLQAGATFYVSSGTVRNLQTNTIKFSDGTTQTTASAGGGGGTSTLQTKVNGVQISSPTKSVSFDSNFTGTESPTGTANISLNPGCTFFIQNTNSLQSGATIYVSSESVNGPLSVFRSNFQALLLPSTTIPFELVNTTSHQLYMIFKTSGTEWWRLGSDVTGLGTPEYDVYNVTTGIKDIAISTNDVMNINATASFPSLTASRPVKLNASKQVTSGLIDVTTDLTGTVPDGNLPANLVHTNVAEVISSSKNITAQLSVNSIKFPDGTIQTSSAPGTTGSFINNQSTLQSGATFYVSSATVQDNFYFSNAQSAQRLKLFNTALPRSFGVGPQTVNTYLALDTFEKSGFAGDLAIVASTESIDAANELILSKGYAGAIFNAPAASSDASAQLFAKNSGLSSKTGAFIVKPTEIDFQISGATVFSWTSSSFRFFDNAAAHYTSFKSSASIPANIDFVLPSSDRNGCWASDGSGNLSVVPCNSGSDIIAAGVVGSGIGQYNFLGTTVTFAAPPVDTSDRVPILNNGAVTWPLAVTDGARLGSTQTFTGADTFTSTSGVNVTYGVVGGSLTATVEATLPNGTNPTISTTGDMAVDTSSGQVVASTNGSTGNVVLPYYIPNSIVIATPTVGDYHFFVKAKREWTVDSVVCISSASTSATVQLFECDANGANCTSMDSATACTTTETAITMTDTDITAGDRVKVMVTATSGTPGEVAVDLYALETRK